VLRLHANFAACSVSTSASDAEAAIHWVLMALPQRWLQQGQTMLPARVSEDGHRVALAPTRTPHVRGKIPTLAKSAVKASIVMAGVASSGVGHPAEVALVAAIGDLSVNSHPMKKDSTGCAPSLHRSPKYPLKSSTNHRYLVDQNNVPCLMVGDAPQTLVANLSPAETEEYLSNRRGYGIKAVAREARVRTPIIYTRSNHIHTIELNYHTSGSLDDPAWAPLIELDAAYTYFPTYAQVLREYNRPKFKPVVLIEGNYESEHLSAVDGGPTQNLRKQEHWTMLSGATGQVYGNYYTWRLSKGWESNIDTAGVNHLCHMAELFLLRRWYDLLPDQRHNVLVGGYGKFSETVGKLSIRLEKYPSFIRQISARVRKSFGWGSIEPNAYATATGTSDGSLVMAYIPPARTVTIDMSRLAGPTTVPWYDPTSGSYAEVVGSPFTNVGKKEYTTPERNNDGDSDWVLLLDASDSM
jgi:Putative collagen-binding domain of a collagenase/Protein of unknown function (DUF4038)